MSETRLIVNEDDINTNANIAIISEPYMPSKHGKVEIVSEPYNPSKHGTVKRINT